ncbi:MAG: BTAD domain-containing putative transcriptional regulator [Solirubrobacteraceae bacterium]
MPAAPGGYRLAVEPDAVDAARFERLADDGGAALARGDHAAAADLLAEALALWRGPALADVPDSTIAQAAAAALEARRLGAGRTSRPISPSGRARASPRNRVADGGPPARRAVLRPAR